MMSRRCVPVGTLGWAALVWTGLVLGAASVAPSLEAVRKLDRLGISEGLSQSWVYSILQDRHGFLWIGTDNGLNRYDGYEVHHYKHRAGDPGSLADSKVYSLLEDRQGRLWVGTVAGGLDRFDPSSGTFEHFPADRADPAGPSDPFVSALLEDRSGRLWVGTYGGLDRFDEESGTFERFRHDPTDPGTLVDDRVRALFQDSRGRLWVGSEGGLDELESETGRVRRHRHTVNPPAAEASGAVKSIAEDPSGTLWIGTRAGLYRYDPETGPVGRSAREPEIPADLADVHVWDLLVYEGDLWIATHGRGVARLDLTSGETEWFRHDPLNPDSLGHDRAKCLFVDRGGLLWIGTMGGGASLWNPRTDAFVVYRHPPRKGEGRERNEIQDILVEPGGRLWVGSAAGLDRFDRSTGRETFLPVSGGVESLARGSDGTIFAASPGGILRVDPEELAAERFASGGASVLLVDSRDRVWAGGEAGLLRYGSGGGLDASYRHDSRGPRSLPHDEVLSLAEDADGTIWVGTRDGVGRYSEEDGAFDVFAAFHDPSGHDGVVSIFSPEPGLLWLATENAGVMRLEVAGDDESLQRLTTEDGLLSDNTAALLGDEEGRIWIGSVEGLTRYDPVRGEARRYLEADGLHGSELHPGAAFLAADGEMFFGGVGGLTTFYPELLRDDRTAPPVAITSVTRGSENLPVLGTFAGTLAVDYRERVVSIEYAALDFGRPRQNRYRHRLLGAEESWLEVETTREVTYAGLGPGRYVFEVMASKADGVWSEEPARLAFVVARPPWRTPWAYLAYAIGALLLVGIVTLARARKLAERRRYEDQLRLMAKAFESTSEGMVITDAGGTILEVNRAFEAITGYREEEIVGRPSKLLDSPRHAPEFYEKLWRRLHERGQWQGELWQRRKSGEEFPAYLTMSALFGDEGRITHYVAVLSDVTDRKRNEEELRRLANYDLLTQLPNRTLFEDRLAHAVAGARQNDERLALLFIGLDRFKQVNDSLGYAAGDVLLQEVAARLQERVRASDTVARLGGDEFTVILEDVGSADEVEGVVEDLVASLSRPCLVDGFEINVTPSVGICLFPDGGSTAAELTQHADAAMHRAKGEGGDAYQLYRDDMDTQVVRRLRLENELRHGLERDELRLHFQPRVVLATGAVRSVEALVRWEHPERGLLPPDSFIGVAEESGLVLPLGEWVLENACRQAVRWLESGIDVRVAVNLSARQFRRGELAETVSRILAEVGLPGERLELEITETTLMADLPAAREALRRLKKLGVYISVDDFGTGYSSLSYLKIFPLDALKIDSSFVRDLGRDPQDEAIVTAITTLARSLDLAVTGEGVETFEQLSFLRDAGCDEIQGFLVGRPRPADELTELLARGSVRLDQLAAGR